MNKKYEKKSILVTGGTGSFGKHFINFLINNYKFKRIIIFSRDEQKHFNLQKEWTAKKYSNLRYFLGDIRDEKRLDLALKDVNFVVHAAAIKHVPISEYNPFEAIQTNILGSQNVISSSLKNNVEKVVALSTDKAVAPINLYGATKLCADKLFLASNSYSGADGTKFSVVRYGNVFGSNGSVIPLFMKHKDKGFFPITNLEMTRFNITLDDGVNFVFNSLESMNGSELFIPKMPSYKIVDLARSINNANKLKIIGIRPGEKVHEELVSKSDTNANYEYKDKFIILHKHQFSKIPNYIKKDISSKKCKEVEKPFSYNSFDNKNYLNDLDIKNLIKNH